MGAFVWPFTRVEKPDPFSGPLTLSVLHQPQTLAPRSREGGGGGEWWQRQRLTNGKKTATIGDTTVAAKSRSQNRNLKPSTLVKVDEVRER